jgi:hypothetical protein
MSKNKEFHKRLSEAMLELNLEQLEQLMDYILTLRVQFDSKPPVDPLQEE